MAVDLFNFLDALAKFVATACTLQYAGMPRQIWISTADEITAGACSPIFTVIRPFGGSLPWTPVALVQVQLETTAPKGSDKDGLNRAQTLFNALLDASGRPARMRQIAAPASGQSGWRANAIDPQIPSMVRRDGNGRGVWVCNVDFKIVALPAT